ncbi:hotdog family protein [Paraburkholderia kururiensis]|uniref:Hotdog family protein n=1 Tax=Paraburkholderia kururiensis TaxID=984307 RepID=A0ABZ0WQX2_9BURK|nr:hotdog family protein [Paraburkholderia kururiensis]WQD79772.1 hotdog family protein [Paraburkholderia kururiensis]
MTLPTSTHALEGDTALPPIEQLVPHRGTMLLLDSVSAFDDESLTAYASVRSDAWYADREGAMPAWIGVELMAQAIAAHVGLLAMRAGENVRPGVLLGTRRYEARMPAFPGGAQLCITIKEVLRSEEGHGAYACTIGHEGALCAEAIVKVYQPRNFQTFIEEAFKP